MHVLKVTFILCAKPKDTHSASATGATLICIVHSVEKSADSTVTNKTCPPSLKIAFVKSNGREDDGNLI